jgi:hypothetical protein
MSLNKLAKQIASKGRQGDTELVHMTRGEVSGLHGLARAMGSRDGLPVNPATGLHEANFLKSILPALAGGVAGYFGGPLIGALAGSAVGAVSNKNDRLAGAIAGGAAGYGGAQIGAGLQEAGSQYLAGAGGDAARTEAAKLGDNVAFTNWDKLKAGVPALLTKEGGKAFIGSAGGKGVDSTGVGGAPLTTFGYAAMPFMMQDPVAADSNNAAAAAHTPYEKQYSGGRWVRDANGVMRFQYIPVTKAAGGTVPYASGGPVKESAKGASSTEIYDYLMGGDSPTRVAVAQRYLPWTVPAASSSSGGEMSIGGGSGSLGAGGIGGFGNTGGTDQGSAGDSEVGDVNIAGGNGLGYANSNWTDPNGADPGSSLGWLGSFIGDPGNASGSGLTSKGERLSDLGSDIAEYDYAHKDDILPSVKQVGEWIVDAVTGVPIMRAVEWAAKQAMNADPTNKNGLNAVNGMDKDSDDARQAAADAAEAQRLADRSWAGAGGGGGASSPSYEGSLGGSGYTGGSLGGYDFSGGDYSSDGFTAAGGGVDFSGSGGWGGGGGGDYGGDAGGGGSSGGWSKKIVRLAAAGGAIEPVALQSGGFVFPADVVSAIGAGSSSAGLEALAKRYGARPVSGKGHGQSDDIHATIDGSQEARVARDEAVLDAAQVAKIGGGDPKKGAKKLYDMMTKVRKQATGSSKQMRAINTNKVLS